MSLLKSSSVAFAYGDRSALRGVDLTLSAGEVVALLGPNGSGKSTLIKCLLGHLPAAGTIEWDGKPLAHWTRRALARRIAYLPQSPVAEPSQTVLDMLRLGRSPYWSAFGLESPRDEAVVRSVSTRLGLDPLLNRPMDELSGGQRQRVFVGRCLVQEPAAMLLDEPSTFLDLRHQVELCQLLRQLAKEQSIGVLMASHDLNLAAAYADRVFVLSDGTVAASGGIDALEPEMLSRVYGVKMV
ncbi:MAG TPA: ABC transporter ATP-binding protein, partial [Tepidisphaeraceae bacterium]|nr:ABC transporter ATP-binding protein [Tepidisphaeraceae bacterium]